MAGARQEVLALSSGVACLRQFLPVCGNYADLMDLSCQTDIDQRMVQVAFRLDAGRKKDLEAVARALGVPLSELLRRLCEVLIAGAAAQQAQQ